MNVEVAYELETEPTNDHFWCLRRAAAALTDQPESIRTELRHNVAVVRFTMRTTAQYKVVDDIAHTFKLNFACYYTYRDNWIRFPR